MTHPFIRQLFLLISLLASMAIGADERILDYHSDVDIHESGELTVTETITVRAEGHNIRRGIYRDFPTSYKDRFGNHYTVEFEVDSVQRDGSPEPWHSEKRPNGVRVYIGNADRMLSPGDHTYQLRFQTNRQLGFFQDHDELYWNATGNGWAFPIDRAAVRISLPFNAAGNVLELKAYTGTFGSSESAAQSSVVDGYTVEFATNRTLAPNEGLTVVVGWPKGLIDEPEIAQKLRWFASDNGAFIVLGIGLLLVLGWYSWAWHQVGRDPRKGVIIPRFKSPEGLSPAACRYVLDMSFNRYAFSAAIISLAVKDQLLIEERSKEFTLRRPASSHPVSKPAALTKGESGVLETLLPHSPSSITLNNKNHAQFQAAHGALKKALKSEYMGRLFHLNTLYLAPPMIVSALTFALALAFRSGPVVWITWVGLSLLLHGLFIWLLRAPTPAGRQVMDEIEGFRMYLDTAEQDRLDRMKSPALTPEVFETFLPYAYALGVENHWCERFARELPQISQNAAYQPGWYSGNYQGMRALNHLGDNFSSSLSSAISSASTPPGSSSGSGGGGFSGGGGGGGGGGGW